MSDLVPNQGDAFSAALKVREERKIETSKEKADTLAALKFIDKTLEWFDLQADEYDKINNLDVESKVPLESQIIANREVSKVLRLKRGELRTYLSAYDPRQK